MTEQTPVTQGVPRLHRIRIRNYRALKDVTFATPSPLTVLLGQNGSGKSTVFDVFAFLSECFSGQMRSAWERRGRFRELRTRGATGPVSFELQYREAPRTRLVSYELQIDEQDGRPIVASESLRWTRGRRGSGRPTFFLRFERGKGEVKPGDDRPRRAMDLDSPEFLAVNVVGQLAEHPRVTALRRFVTSWYLSYLSAENARGIPESGPQERLSETGDNLANVVQYLKERHPDRLNQILRTLARRVPRLQSVDAQTLRDGRLMLEIKDGPFEQPILAKYASDGTLRMLAYLTLLYDPSPPQLIGIEEPENQLHPLVLPGLVEECRAVADRSQVIVTSHSPYLVNGCQADEVWVLRRDDDGFTQVRRAADVPGISAFVSEGASLGDLWLEGYLQEPQSLGNSSVAAGR